eukprot:scaffold1364_cov75-Skeletonema_dohrnii-CCMP3373.AAC.2
MDTVMVLGNGRVLFASDSQTGQGMRSSVSTSNFIHSIISEQTVSERLSSSVFDNSISIESEGGDSESVGTSFQGNDSFYWSRLRLWQVWPLLRRLHLECPPGLQDVILLPFGKMLSAAMQTYQAVAGFYSAYSYLSLVVSGFFVNPAKIPSYLHWIMYMSLSFWGVSGVQLSQLEHSDIGNKNCLTMISCIAYNPNFIAHLTGYTVLTTAQKSMSTLCFAAILLVLIEYCLLLKKVSQRGNYKRVEVEAASNSNDINNNGNGISHTTHF